MCLSIQNGVISLVSLLFFQNVFSIICISSKVDRSTLTSKKAITGWYWCTSCVIARSIPTFALKWLQRHLYEPPNPDTPLATPVISQSNSEVRAGQCMQLQDKFPAFSPHNQVVPLKPLEILESPLFVSGSHLHASFLSLKHIYFWGDTEPSAFLYSTLWFQEQVRVDFFWIHNQLI